MAKCPKCGNGWFELVTEEPQGSRFKDNFVTCTSCGTVVGVVEFFNNGATLVDLQEHVNRVESRITDLANQVESLTRAVTRLK